MLTLVFNNHNHKPIEDSKLRTISCSVLEPANMKRRGSLLHCCAPQCNNDSRSLNATSVVYILVRHISLRYADLNSSKFSFLLYVITTKRGSTLAIFIVVFTLNWT